MQEFTPEQLKESFDKLPKQMQDAISSPEIHDKIMAVGKRRNLMIDQIGDLVDQVGLIMLGLAKSASFVRDTSRRLSISPEQAQAIAADINIEVLDAIKQGLRESEDKANATRMRDISSLERAGGFEIEQEIPGNGEAGAERASSEAAAMTQTDRINMLSDIENPKPSRETVSAKLGAYPIESHTEPMVDQLLNGPAAVTEEKVTRKAVDTPRYGAPEAKPQPPSNLPTDDPYREAVK